MFIVIANFDIFRESNDLFVSLVNSFCHKVGCVLCHVVNIICNAGVAKTVSIALKYRHVYI